MPAEDSAPSFKSVVSDTQNQSETDPALDSAWDAFCRWDRAAIARKRRLDISRAVVFALLLVAAVAGVVASQLKQPLIAGIAAAASAAAALLSREAVGPAVERLWLVARAATETLKSEAFKYAVGIRPYDGADKAERLISAISAIEADNISGMSGRAARGEPRTIPPTEIGRSEYLTKRVEEQLAWYEGKARFYNARSMHWRFASLVLGLTGAALSGMAASSADRAYLGAWVGVIGTLAGILAAHVAGSRLSYLAQTYELTGRRLKHLRTAWKFVPLDQQAAKWNDFVLNCEHTISAEREQWMKEWQRQIAETAATATGGGAPQKNHLMSHNSMGERS